jgi:hypothetical protein
LITTSNLAICKYLRKISIEVEVGVLGQCAGIPEVKVASAVRITGYVWNKEISGSNKKTLT